jgi:glycosyltransferase involved in cell wall biosynthesis
MTRKTRVALVATHPIQYQVPWFQKLAQRTEIELKVYFALLPDAEQQGVGFGIPFRWDIPMLEGYRWHALENARRRPELGRFLGSSTPGVLREFLAERPDAAIITGWNSLSLLQALWACARLRIPRLVRGESNALRRRPAHVRLLHRALLSQFDAFLSIGKANRAFYRANAVPEQRLFDAPYFVDNARFARSADELRPTRAALRERWAVPVGAVCFLFAGKLEPKKRVLDLIAALTRARAASPRAHLLVVGVGAQMEEAQALAGQSGGAVSFAGFLNQSEMPGAYVAADCLVLPSDYGETWGLVVNEAMACGLPAVVSDRVGCGADLIVEGETGHVFPYGDTHALARLLADLAAAAPRLQDMGERARSRVASYSVDAAVEGTLSAIRFVVQRPRGKSGDVR